MKVGRTQPAALPVADVLDDTVVVPVPPLAGLSVEQVGVLRADLGQRYVEFTVEMRARASASL